jgi:hypothetical protein
VFCLYGDSDHEKARSKPAPSLTLTAIFRQLKLLGLGQFVAHGLDDRVVVLRVAGLGGAEDC